MSCRPSMNFARLATVDRSKMARIGIRTSNSRLAMAITCVASNESPLSSKKLSSIPMRSNAKSSSQIGRVSAPSL